MTFEYLLDHDTDILFFCCVPGDFLFIVFFRSSVSDFISSINVWCSFLCAVSVNFFDLTIMFPI